MSNAQGSSDSPFGHIFPRQRMWRCAAAPATSWLHSRTQIVAVPPESPRAGHFPPPCPCPGFPAFDSASRQKHPLINNPTGVILCTVLCPVPSTFPTSSCPHRSRDQVPGWHRWQDEVCPSLGSPQPSCTCARWGWGQAGAAGPAHPAFFLQSLWFPFPRSNLSPHFL